VCAASAPSGPPDSRVCPSGIAKRKSKGMLVVIGCLCSYIRYAYRSFQRACCCKAHRSRQFFITSQGIAFGKKLSLGHRTTIQGKQHTFSLLHTYHFVFGALLN